MTDGTMRTSETGDERGRWLEGGGLALLVFAWFGAVVASSVLLYQFSQCSGDSPTGPPTCGMVFGVFLLWALMALVGSEVLLALFGWLVSNVRPYREILVALLAPIGSWVGVELLVGGNGASSIPWAPPWTYMFISSVALFVHVGAVGRALFKVGRDVLTRDSTASAST